MAESSGVVGMRPSAGLTGVEWNEVKGATLARRGWWLLVQGVEGVLSASGTGAGLVRRNRGGSMC